MWLSYLVPRGLEASYEPNDVADDVCAVDAALHSEQKHGNEH
jgi:hypothetical protein